LKQAGSSVLQYIWLAIPLPLLKFYLRNRTFSTCFKAKSDCAKETIPETALEGLWQRLLAEDNAVVVFTPYSGMMSRISDSFPS